MGRNSLLLIVVALMSVGTISPSFSASCAQLRQQRNSIYKAAGYCFGTPRGIREQGGNAGCSYDSQADVPLSNNDRQRVNAIRNQERIRGCA